MKRLSLILCSFVALLAASCGGPKPQPSQVVPTAHYDLAIMDAGRLVLYDIAAQRAVPIEAETDSLFNCVFTDDGMLFYSVKRGNETFLKYVDLSDPALQPQLATDWGLTWDLCYGTAYYCHYAPVLDYYPEVKVVGMAHMMEPDYGFSEYKIYDRATGEAVSPWDWDGDASFLEDPEWQGDYDEDVLEGITDRLPLDVDLDYGDELPMFQLISVDPTQQYVIFEAKTHEGDDMEFHGPQCVASLDGSLQRVLGDFDSSYPAQWMDDGTLVYGADGIHRLNLADGTNQLLYPNTCVFVKR